jgi:hypothetical protein
MLLIRSSAVFKIDSSKADRQVDFEHPTKSKGIRYAETQNSTTAMYN